MNHLARTRLGRTLVWCTLGVALGCAHSEPQTLTPAAGATRPAYGAPGGAIRTYGVLRDLTETGRIGPSVWLSTLKDDPALVGLGSLSELRGEVLIVGGKVWLGYPTGPEGSYARELGVSDETAAFLVTASVPAWRTLSLARDVRFEALEAGLEQLGRDAGIDGEKPFPFVIEGTLNQLEFNVVNGRGFEAGQPIPRVVLMAAATRAAIDSTEGTIVGFFGKRGSESFAHPGTLVHMHVLLPEENQVAHVDHVDLPAGVTVRIPAPRR
jgi:acetolactate decarboxylase